METTPGGGDKEECSPREPLPIAPSWRSSFENGRRSKTGRLSGTPLPFRNLAIPSVTQSGAHRKAPRLRATSSPRGRSPSPSAVGSHGPGSPWATGGLHADLSANGDGLVVPSHPGIRSGAPIRNAGPAIFLGPYFGTWNGARLPATAVMARIDPWIQTVDAPVVVRSISFRGLVLSILRTGQRRIPRRSIGAGIAGTRACRWGRGRVDQLARREVVLLIVGAEDGILVAANSAAIARLSAKAAIRALHVQFDADFRNLVRLLLLLISVALRPVAAARARAPEGSQDHEREQHLLHDERGSGEPAGPRALNSSNRTEAHSQAQHRSRHRWDPRLQVGPGPGRSARTARSRIFH